MWQMWKKRKEQQRQVAVKVMNQDRSKHACRLVGREWSNTPGQVTLDT